MFYVEMDFEVVGSETPEELEEHLDHVLESLYDDDTVTDPDYVATLVGGRVGFSMAVDTEDEPQALGIALTAMRCAIHGAEGCTPGWEAHFKQIQSLVRVENVPVPA